ncbi:RDD family protein [Streptomyces sp. KL118A]|uniref:RDD family protein n=1 Tax=Streptomyces sp. KL118A TaxID=3045153 RepID=UPI00278BFC92|nr:RDD family protein [Streptomyces sp. KL118A]
MIPQSSRTTARQPSAAADRPLRTATPPRRLTASAVDAAVALLCGLAAAAAVGVTVADGVVEVRVQSPAMWAAGLGAALGFSLLNHTLLTRLTGASVGKLLTGLRVVRTSDAGRPRLLPLTGRWLFGFYWTVVFVPLHVVTDSDVEQQDAVGLRVVRR